MKVGLLTFVCAQNWGAVLQGYSTQEFINNNTSHECEVLNWEPVDNSLLKPYKTIPNLLHSILHISRCKQRIQKFENFRKRYIKWSPICYTEEEREKLNEKYQAFIVGSDQVWITLDHVNPTMFLNFVSDENKKISYAPSFGADRVNESCNSELKAYIEKFDAMSKKYPENHYILSSRPLEEFMGWNQFEELHAMPLSKEQALSLINKIEYDQIIKDKFYKELDEYLYEKYETFASNPLLLTIMLLTFESRASIPDKLNDFFEQAFTTLFHTHDATKGGYKRDIRSKLGYEDFKAVFSYFCFKSFFNSDYKFSENKALEYIGAAKQKRIIDTYFNSMDYLKDLTNSVCMLIHEGLEFRFSHRSFQEYFAALYTVQLSDSQQKRFLKLWLQDNSYRSTSNYLDMLYELQPLRFVKNIISPAIRELQEKFKKNNESEEWLIGYLYEDVGIRKYTNGEKRCAVTIKNFYYHDMIIRACSISELYNNSKQERMQRNKVREEKLIKILEEEYHASKPVRFEDIIRRGYTKEMLEALYWVIERYKFAVNYVDMVDKDPLAKKKRFSSMLEEL